MPTENLNCAVDHSDLGFIKISGADAKKFLQGQLTCDLNAVTASQSSLGGHCNPEGRLLSFFRISYYNDAYYLQLPQEILFSALAALKKYAVFFKVALEDVTDTLKSFGLYGLPYHNTLKTLIQNLPENNGNALIHQDIYVIRLAGNIPYYEIIGDEKALTEIKNKLEIKTSQNILKYLNIMEGIPSLYLATIAKILPHDINLPGIEAVSFHKGCYTGQEIIARMHYRGKLKKSMFRASVQTDLSLKPGDEIYHSNSNEPYGMIIESFQASQNHYDLLISAQRTENETTSLFLDPQKKYPLHF